MTKSARTKALVLLGIFGMTTVAVKQSDAGTSGFGVIGYTTGCQAYSGSLCQDWWKLEPNDGTNVKVVTLCYYDNVSGQRVGKSVSCTSVPSGNCCTLVSSCTGYTCPDTDPSMMAS